MAAYIYMKTSENGKKKKNTWKTTMSDSEKVHLCNKNNIYSDKNCQRKTRDNEQKKSRPNVDARRIKNATS